MITALRGSVHWFIMDVLLRLQSHSCWFIDQKCLINAAWSLRYELLKQESSSQIYMTDVATRRLRWHHRPDAQTDSLWSGVHLIIQTLLITWSPDHLITCSMWTPGTVTNDHKREPQLWHHFLFGMFDRKQRDPYRLISLSELKRFVTFTFSIICTMEPQN